MALAEADPQAALAAPETLSDVETTV
jgi:hypothetical protein